MTFRRTAGPAHLLALVLLTLAAGAPAAVAKPAPVKPWPPADGPGDLFVHYGEEHINDDDGATLLPRVVREAGRYEPVLVTMSGDKANDGKPDEFQLWSEAMAPYDEAGIPWFAGVGNHDRKAPPGFPGGVSPSADFGPYAQFFAARPYPMGDARGYGDPRISPGSRPAEDPDGASSHYFVDAGDARWIFLDNSCFSLTGCDPLQNPSAQNAGGSETQYDFLDRVASEAAEQGRLAFVVMHMPTRDPRDQSYAEPTSVMHTMGKGPLGTGENTMFERVAAESGVDGVFAAHIKGQFLYRGEGEIPYFVDGGAGGELYTTGPVGVDHGYWHGFRLVRVADGGFETDVVPIFVPGGISVHGPASLMPGEETTFSATGRQPVFNNQAKVEALELRDPDPVRPGGPAGSAWLPDAAVWAGPPLAVVVLLTGATLMAGRRRGVVVPALAAAGALLVSAGASIAQQSEPTTTPLESLPNPARMWTSSDPLVLDPVASDSDDPRRSAHMQTEDGTFRAACPGHARLTIASGFAEARKRVTVPSEKGRIVRSIRGGREGVKAGRKAKLATIRLAQPARVLASVRRRGRQVAGLGARCVGAPRHRVKWDGEKRNGEEAKPGRYRLKIRIPSDRRPLKRTIRFDVR